MEICYNYMIMEKLELEDINKTKIFAKLTYRDDYKFFSNKIILRSIEENRIIYKMCAFKKKVNIVIDAFSRYIIKIISIDEDKIIYDNKDVGGDTNEI